MVPKQESNMTTEATEHRNPQVTHWLGRLNETLDTTAKAVGALMNRLSPVLRNEPPPGRPEEEAQELVPLANELQQVEEKAATLLFTLQSAMDRLEI